MAINKVEFGDQTLIDLTGDTVTPEDVLGGKTFHTKSGDASVGTAGPYAGSATNGGPATTAKKLFGQDTRSVNSPPSFYLTSGQNSTLVTEFKNRAVIDAPGSSNFGTLITVTPWMDPSGGLPVQTYVDNTGQKAIRFAQTSETWGSWSTLASNSDIPSVGNGTIKLQRNGVDIMTFTTNQNSNTTGNLIVPTKVSELTNDSEFISDDDPRLTDSRNAKDVYAWAKASTKPSYTASEVGLGNVPNVTTDNQTPTVTEASTRANIATGDTLKTIIGKIKKFFTDLKTVAFTGSYNDLTNKPTIPAAQVNSDWNATSGVAQILNKPTIPTVNNATLTIQKNGTTVKTFTANASSNVTANITVPTKVSELTNDSGFVTTDTTYTFATGDSNGQIKVTPSGGSAQNVSVKGLGTAAYTSSDIYRKSLLKRFQNSGLTNGTWYKLFTIKYTSYNYLSFRMIVKIGYQPLCEVLVSVRYTPTGIEANSSYIKIIPSGNSLDTVRMYQVDTQTIGIAAVVAGGTTDFGFEILDENSEGNAIPISSFVVSDPFVALSAAPTKFGVHHYITGSYTDLVNKPTIPSAASSAPGDITTGTASAGSSSNYARQDHTHKIATASTSTYGATKLNSATNSTSTTEAATPSAVKAAYDLAASKGTGTVTSVKVGSTSYSPSSGVISLPAYPTDTNTHRPIQVNGTEVLGNNTTALNLKAGSNVTLTNSSGTVTITASGSSVFNNAVRFNPDTDDLQYYDGSTWQNLMHISGRHIDAFILFASSLTASTGSFTLYFIEVERESSNVVYLRYTDEKGFSLSTHTGYTLTTELQNTYGLNKIQYNASSAPYNTYIYASKKIRYKPLNVSSTNDISQIEPAIFPVSYSGMYTMNSGGYDVVNSQPSNATNRICAFGFIEPE